MSETALALPLAGRGRAARPRRLSLGATSSSLGWEVVKGGFVELWAHKLRSTLTLTLLDARRLRARRDDVGHGRRHGQDRDRASPG